jgi:hypothetical protein
MQMLKIATDVIIMLKLVTYVSMMLKIVVDVNMMQCCARLSQPKDGL